MSEYRKKPVTITAWRVLDLNRWAENDWQSLPECIREDYENPQGVGDWVFGERLDDGSRGICIPSWEGTVLAGSRDWVLRGVKGEFYCCRGDIFAETYEAVGGGDDE